MSWYVTYANVTTVKSNFIRQLANYTSDLREMSSTITDSQHHITLTLLVSPQLRCQFFL